jgi:hypothetical protein
MGHLGFLYLLLGNISIIFLWVKGRGFHVLCNSL